MVHSPLIPKPFLPSYPLIVFLLCFLRDVLNLSLYLSILFFFNLYSHNLNFYELLFVLLIDDRQSPCSNLRLLHSLLWIWGTKDSVFISFPCLCSSPQCCFCLIVSIFVFHTEAPLRHCMNFGFLRVWGLEGWGQALSTSGCSVLRGALLWVGGLGSPCHWRNPAVRILKLVRFPKDDFSIPRPGK